MTERGDEEFAVRLRSVMERGDLTIGDLHHWFERPRATVRYWVKRGHGVYHLGGRSIAGLYSRLEQLEQVVELAEKAGESIVPAKVSQRDRPSYIKRIRDEYARLSAAGSAV